MIGQLISSGSIACTRMTWHADQRYHRLIAVHVSGAGQGQDEVLSSQVRIQFDRDLSHTGMLTETPSFLEAQSMIGEL